MALQALSAKWAAGGNPGPHHGELHHFDKLEIIESLKHCVIEPLKDQEPLGLGFQ
jgi:hypothetical protein